MSVPSRHLFVTCVVTALFVIGGCSKSADAPKPTAKSPIRRIDTSSLPALGEYVPGLDGGRIEIAGPSGWQLVARTKGYVVRFLGSSDDQYPMILVQAEDSSTEPLTAENVVAFASALAPDGTAQPAAVGRRFGVLQLKRGREPNTIDRILERLIFTTVIGERTYVLELRDRQGRLGESQGALFAVIAGMREAEATSGESVAGDEAVTNQGDKAGKQGDPERAEEKKATKGAGRKELDELFE